MKKILIALIAITTILAGCAKVERQAIGCTKAPPARPVIDSFIYASPNDHIYLTASAPMGSTLIWTSPKGEVSIGYVDLYVTTDELGTWTVVDRLDSCVSDKTYFTLTSDPHISYGNPPCNTYNNIGVVNTSNGSAFMDFDTRYMNETPSTGTSSYRYELNGTDTYYSDFRIAVTAGNYLSYGTYYAMDSTATPDRGNYATITTRQGDVYQGVAGNVYITINNGSTYVVLCNTTFRAAGNRRVTLTGTIRYY